MNIQVEVSAGELLDKITILEIKAERIKDTVKLQNITKELNVLNKTRADSVPDSRELEAEIARLKQVNETLWKIEDDIRDKESEGKFDDEFIQLARSVYFTNDKRSEIKRRINLLLGSELIEEKSYSDYQRGEESFSI